MQVKKQMAKQAILGGWRAVELVCLTAVTSRTEVKSDNQEVQ